MSGASTFAFVKAWPIVLGLVAIVTAASLAASASKRAERVRGVKRSAWATAAAILTAPAALLVVAMIVGIAYALVTGPVRFLRSMGDASGWWQYR